jgi:hypothetical protein
MGPGHHPHLDGGPHGDGFGFWWLGPLLPVLLLGVLLLLLWAMHTTGMTEWIGGAGARLAAGSRARWRAAIARHREIAAAFATYECDPQAVLHRPALADVRQPATARFVEAFAEACALTTDRYPGRARAETFAAAVDRSARTWTAATQAAVPDRAARRALLSPQTPAAPAA